MTESDRVAKPHDKKACYGTIVYSGENLVNTTPFFPLHSAVSQMQNTFEAPFSYSNTTAFKKAHKTPSKIREFYGNIFSKKVLTKYFCYAIMLGSARKAGDLGVAQLVARYLGVVEAASSSLVTQTRKSRIDLVSVLLFLI